MTSEPQSMAQERAHTITSQSAQGMLPRGPPPVRHIQNGYDRGLPGNVGPVEPHRNGYPPDKHYSLFTGFMHLASGLSVGLTGLAAGYAIGIVGDMGVRCYMQQSRIFVGMVLILIFGEVLGLYGYVTRRQCFQQHCDTVAYIWQAYRGTHSEFEELNMFQKYRYNQVKNVISSSVQPTSAYEFWAYGASVQISVHSLMGEF